MTQFINVFAGDYEDRFTQKRGFGRAPAVFGGGPDTRPAAEVSS